MFNLSNLYASQLERPRIESAEIAEQGFPILNLFFPRPLQFLFLLGGGIILNLYAPGNSLLQFVRKMEKDVPSILSNFFSSGKLKTRFVDTSISLDHLESFGMQMAKLIKLLTFT